jgi:hypothetical protein
MFKLSNYDKGNGVVLGLFQIILLFIKLILLGVNLVQLLRLYMFILLFMPYFLVYN